MLRVEVHIHHNNSTDQRLPPRWQETIIGVLISSRDAPVDIETDAEEGAAGGVGEDGLDGGCEVGVVGFDGGAGD